MDPAMDPGLWELYESGSPDDEVSVILRMAPGAEPPPTIRIVSQFGDILTARMRRGDIVATRQSPGVLSLKAGSIVTLPPPLERHRRRLDADGEAWRRRGRIGRRRAPASPAISEDGRGVVVGICDWGFDFTHPNFRNADGTTRLLCLWDQRGFGDPLAPAPVQPGPAADPRGDQRRARDAGSVRGARAITRRAAIPRTPARTARTSPTSSPATAASRGPRSGSPRQPTSSSSTSPPAARRAGQPRRFGRPARGPRLLPAAGRRPAVRPAPERGQDRRAAPRRHAARTRGRRDAQGARHRRWCRAWATTRTPRCTRTRASAPISGTCSTGSRPPNDRTPNELEIWYSGEDVFDVTLMAPDGREFTVAARQPHAARPTALSGLGQLLPSPARAQQRPQPHRRLSLHGGAERPLAGRAARPRRRRRPAARLDRTRRQPAAINPASRDRRPRRASPRTRSATAFARSPSAPTTPPSPTGRRRVSAAAAPPPTAGRSRNSRRPATGFARRARCRRDGWRGEPRLCVKSGTSMAAPWVSGTVALMMQRPAGR